MATFKTVFGVLALTSGLSLARVATVATVGQVIDLPARGGATEVTEDTEFAGKVIDVPAAPSPLGVGDRFDGWAIPGGPGAGHTNGAPSGAEYGSSGCQPWVESAPDSLSPEGAKEWNERTDLDCNGNGVPDATDIASGFSLDANTNGIPDECDVEVCDDLWGGFTAYPNGTKVTDIDYNGDGFYWVAPAGTNGFITGLGCQGGGGADKAVLVIVNTSLADPRDGYVASEYFRTVDGRLDCGAAIYSLTFSFKIPAGINSKYDWEYFVYDARSAERVVQLEFPSKVSTLVPPDQQQRILVKNPSGSPEYFNTGVAFSANVCYAIKVVLNNLDDSVNVYVTDLTVPKVTTTPLDANARRMDYFKVQAELNGASNSVSTYFKLDAFTFCLTGPALLNLPDCNHNCIDDYWDIVYFTSTDCNSNSVPDECDASFGTSTDCNSNGVPDECDVVAGTSFDCQPNGVSDDCDILLGTSLDCNENALPDECEDLGGTATLFVDADAPGTGTGRSWGDACHELRTALCLATHDALVTEIRVAEGTYKPAGPGGDRAKTFQLVSGVAVYGGYAGWGHAEPDERDIVLYETVLSGDLNGDDGPGFTNNGENSFHVVTAGATVTDTGVLDGFTITGGNADGESWPDYLGGGMYLRYSSPTITNNTITGNSAFEGSGGGLYLDSSSPTIANNTITGNSAHSGGGGLFLSGGSPTITNNTISGNSAAYIGGGLYLGYSSPTIANNTITGNSAAYYGGGLCLLSSSPTITNNTITDNSAFDGSGGGLYLDYYSSPTIANTIIAFNSSGVYGSGTPTLRNNCVYGNTAYNYAGLTDPTGTDGNISVDPLLAGLDYGNGHLQADSPCVDAGDNAYALGDLDIDGQPRIQPAGGTVDMGADESDGTVWPGGPYVIVRVSPEGDDSHDGSSWALAKRTVQAGIDAAGALGGEVWVEGGTYYERIILRPYAYVYGGFAGGETQRDERDWSANVTILDGQQQGSVVTARAGYRVSAIDGFTITNGSALVGGGLCLVYSSPTITNNTITGNGASYGGGVYLVYSSPTIASNTITDNSAYYGGGLYLIYCSSPVIANNTITGDSATYSGGGLFLYSSSSTITNNTITGNASHDGGGLGLESSSSPTIANNTITGNSTTYFGGGLYLRDSSPTIANNTIKGNSAREGGGLRLESSSSPTIANNTITGNSADFGGGLILYSSSPTIVNTIVAFNSSGVLRFGSGTATLRHNCVYGNTAYNYSGLTDPTGTDGNISADPRFVDADGPDGIPGTEDDNLRLSPGSPCIDAGSNGAVPADRFDLDGDGDTTEPIPFDLDGAPRFMDDLGTPDTGVGVPPIVDLGAYEFQETTPYLVQSIPSNQSSLWRTENNTIRLTFGGDITVPEPGQVRIQEMLPNGAFGPDLSTNGFTFTVEDVVEGAWESLVEQSGSFAPPGLATFNTPRSQGWRPGLPNSVPPGLPERWPSYSVPKGLPEKGMNTDVGEVIAHPRILKMQENGSVLTHRTWIAIRNVGSAGGWTGVGLFEVQYVVQVGDVNNDGKVLANDLSAIFPKIPTNPAGDQERADVNGDGHVLANDFSVVFPRIPSAPVPKPSGH